MTTTWYHVVRAYVGWYLAAVGYWIRPYDMLADRRRWFWQPAARCGFCMCTEDCEDA